MDTSGMWAQHPAKTPSESSATAGLRATPTQANGGSSRVACPNLSSCHGLPTHYCADMSTTPQAMPLSQETSINRLQILSESILAYMDTCYPACPGWILTGA